MFNYSQNELDFFRTLLFDYDIRIDGRTKLSIRDYDMLTDVIPSCLSSLKLTYNDNQKEILFTVKGEIVHGGGDLHGLRREKLLSVSVDSMYKIEDLKLKKEVENQIENLLLSKISFDALKVNKSSDEFYWKLYIDVYIFDVLKVSLLQMLMLGIKHLLKNVKLPRVVVFTNEITGNKEFDLVELYEDVAEQEKEYVMEVDVPDVFVFAILNNNIFLDPTEEEFSISSSTVIISSHKGRVEEVQSLGSSVDIHKIQEFSAIIQSL